MKISVRYGSKTFGFDNHIRKYRIEIEQITDQCSPENGEVYPCHEVMISIRADTPAYGRGRSDDVAFVTGGNLKLSHNAARKLATSLLKFLDRKKPRKRKLKIAEKPNRRGWFED